MKNSVRDYFVLKVKFSSGQICVKLHTVIQRRNHSNHLGCSYILSPLDDSLSFTQYTILPFQYRSTNKGERKGKRTQLFHLILHSCHGREKDIVLEATFLVLVQNDCLPIFREIRKGQVPGSVRKSYVREYEEIRIYLRPSSLAAKPRKSGVITGLV